MFERFSRPARDTVVAAQVHARDLGAAQLGTEHLLLALAPTPDATGMASADPPGASAGDANPPSPAGRAAAALTTLGIDRPAIMSELADPNAANPPGAGFSQQDADALARLGIDLPEVLARIEAQFGSLPAAGSARRSARLRLTRNARKALQLSLREAIWLKSPEIGTEHLLLGLVRGEDCRAARILAQLGARPDAVRNAVLAQISRAA